MNLHKVTSESIIIFIFSLQRMLHTGDHLNERYWRKKLTYLSLIASHLTEHRTQLSILSVQYRTTGEPGLYCVSLLVTPEPSVGKKAKLNIIAVPEDKAIKLSRCYPQVGTLTFL
jgi:Nrap protein.